MKTPEEIKKGLWHCGEDGCADCPYDDDCGMADHFTQIARDALAYIQQLEAGIDHAEKVAKEAVKSITENLDKLQSRLAQVEQERDALIYDLDKALTWDEAADCHFCKHRSEPICYECEWQWRGVCPENTNVEVNE